MSNKTKTAICSLTAVALLLIAILFVLASVGTMQAQDSASQQAGQLTELQVNDIAVTEEDLAIPANQASFPHAWTLSDFTNPTTGTTVPKNACVEMLASNDFNVVPRCNGKEAPLSDGDTLSAPQDMVVARHDGDVVEMPSSNLFVNLPDIAPDMLYDVMYSYAAPSQCNDIEIPGLTGHRVTGYADERQYNPYLAREEFAVPIAYDTALKLLSASEALSRQGYRIKVWDAYRPYDASVHISNSFKTAYANDAKIRDGIGGWGLSWYAADGASGHNFGTDIDLTLATSDGNDIIMPSGFDSFDVRAHLTTSQMRTSSITEDDYRDEVLSNDACMALHRCMKAAGFGELASEWWHFTDNDNKKSVAERTGANGANFAATIE